MRTKGLSTDDERELDEYYDTHNNKSNMTNTPLLQQIKGQVKCKNESQKAFLKLIREKEIIVCKGVAGTGKTYIACAEALHQIKKHPGKYKEILLIKSVTTLKDEDLGYLKGTVKDKMEPYMQSFMSNIQKFVGRALTGQLEDAGFIRTVPIAFIRGVTFDNAIIIVDEVQNLSESAIRTILTRLGSDSKMILMGDINQIDKKNPDNNGLGLMFDHFSDMKEIGLFTFNNDDVVRNPLIIKIEERFRSIKR